MMDTQRTRMQREADRQTVIACKSAIIALRNFVQTGEPLDPGPRDVLLRRYNGDTTPLPYANHRIIPEVRAWIDQHIPLGYFTTEAEIDAWTTHRGLADARHSDRIWFWMASDWWHPKRLPRTA